MNNISTSSLTSYEATIDWIVLSLYFITAIIAIFGNIYVCLVIYYKKKLRSTTYMLVLNMAISDIIGGVVIPGQWLFCSTYMLETGDFAQRICGLTKSTQILSYYVSTFTMTAIAYDRYRLICKPYSRKIRPLIPILVIWILGILFVLTTFFSMKVNEYFTPAQGLIGCRMLFMSDVGTDLRKWRGKMILFTQYVVPLAITGCLYGMVVHKVSKRERIGSVSETRKQSLNKSKRRTIKMLIIITVLFALVWFPNHLIHFFKYFTNILTVVKGKCNATTYYVLCYWLAISSCAFNPFIYYYFNDDFKREAIRYWNCIIPCLKFEQIVKDKTHVDSSVTNTTASSIVYKSTYV